MRPILFFLIAVSLAAQISTYPASGGSVTPGGASGSVQANGAGALAGSPLGFDLTSIDAVPAFTGTGLNDMWEQTIQSPQYSDSAANPFASFTVVIDGTGTPDTFKWKKNGGAFTAGIPIAGAAVNTNPFTADAAGYPLSDNIVIAFNHPTGHALNDTWVVHTGTLWHIGSSIDAQNNYAPVVTVHGSNQPGDEIGWHLNGMSQTSLFRSLNNGYIAYGWGNNTDMWDLPNSTLITNSSYFPYSFTNDTDIPANMVLSSVMGYIRMGTNSFPTTEYLRVDPAGNIGVGPFPDFVHPSPTGIKQGYLSVEDASQLGAESLTNGALTSGTSWTAAGDWALTGDHATYTHATGAGTLTQASGTLATAGTGNRWYELTYSVSGVTGSIRGFPSGIMPPITCAVTTAFATASPSLFFDSSTGTAHTFFRSAASPGNFVITCTSTAAAIVTIDNLSLKEITGGAIESGAALRSSLLGTTGRTLTYINAMTLIDGDQVYCADCTVTSGIDDTCAASGSGASVVRVNGVLRCRI